MNSSLTTALLNGVERFENVKDVYLISTTCSRKNKRESYERNFFHDPASKCRERYVYCYTVDPNNSCNNNARINSSTTTRKSKRPSSCQGCIIRLCAVIHDERRSVRNDSVFCAPTDHCFGFFRRARCATAFYRYPNAHVYIRAI